MADWEEVADTLLGKMTELALALDGKVMASTESGSREAAHLALAIHHLAEARAWLVRADQPHGGTSNPGAHG